MSHVKANIVVQELAVRIQQPAIKAVVGAGQGPAGPPGTDGAAPEITAIAAHNMSAGRVVVMDGGQLEYFQPANPAHIGRVVGITKTSALTGEPSTVQTGGIATDVSFSFPADAPVFAGADGELTATPPVSGLVQKIGVALSGAQILINITISLQKT